MTAKEFDGFAGFIEHLEGCVLSYNTLKKITLESVGHHIEDKAKAKIGILQHEDGPYDAWEQLAEPTKTQKEKLGVVYNEDYNPLFRHGELRESIQHQLEPDTVTIGSENDIAVYQEEGTEDIPARPFLGPAMYEERAEIKAAIDNLLLTWITGK